MKEFSPGFSRFSVRRQVLNIFGFSGPTFSLAAIDNLYVTQTSTAWGTLIASVPIKLCGISCVTVYYSFKLFYHLKM